MVEQRGTENARWKEWLREWTREGERVGKGWRGSAEDQHRNSEPIASAMNGVAVAVSEKWRSSNAAH